MLSRFEAIERPLRALPRWAAGAVLALLLGVMVWSVIETLPGDAAPQGVASVATDLAEGDGDLALYQRISDRVTAGENYYEAALEEHRAGNYPAFPFFTVRLPTLASLHGLISEAGVAMVLFLLLPAVIMLMMHRLKGQVSPPERVAAGIAILLASAGVIIPEAPLIHELVAGLLLSIALVLYQPERWWPSLLLLALALAVRELAVPFALLWLAFAAMQRRWKEAGAIIALLGLFAIGMYLHYLGVTAHRLPGDGVSQGWDSFAGPILPLTALSKLTVLLLAPLWLAAPLAVLPLMGWLGLGGRLGLFASLWFTGFFIAMALFARPENFYWVQLTLPAYLAGLAFVPRALADLGHAMKGAKERQT